MQQQWRLIFVGLLCLGSLLNSGMAASVPDEDADGVADVDDRCKGTVPGVRVDLWGCDKAPSIIMPTIVFPLASSKLAATERQRLDELAAVLTRWPHKKIEVDGHTCSLGKPSYNKNLSVRRAKAVKNYLAGKGVAANQLIVTGYGEARPQASNGNEDGRQLNRRVILRQVN